ncbi:hypothetical protein [Salinarimonas chemoclinalis]|uniref:hypothetical protein n=1 Tax=Salinarimonas chemoclinalis TaxID=3241599 RepID=UPI003557E46D
MADGPDGVRMFDPAALGGAGQARPGERAVAEAVLAFETLMVQSLVASGFAQQNLLRNLPGNDVGNKIQKMRSEEEERMREIEQELEEQEREAERG